VGLPYLTAFTVLRFSDDHSAEAALELISVAVDPGATRLPWEIAGDR
jgi:hypothetical protein